MLIDVDYFACWNTYSFTTTIIISCIFSNVISKRFIVLINFYTHYYSIADTVKR